MYRTPFLQVLGPAGDLVVSEGGRLVGVKLIDRGGYESDEAVITLRRKPPYPAAPALGTPYTIRLGWSEAQAVVTGYYTLQRIRYAGNPRSGQQMQLICRAGDFIDHLKQVDSEHFDEKTGHKTLGDVFRSLFKATGKEVVVSPEIAKRAIPGGYMLRWNQSAINFATELADDNGAMVKPMGDKMVVMKRGDGRSGGGRTLPKVIVTFNENYEYDVDLEPRFEFQKVSASYVDTDKGTLEREDKQTGFKASREALPHPFGSKDAAQAAAASAAQEWGRFTGTGLFTIPGEPSAVAQADVGCVGFGTPIDTIQWEASGVTHDVVPNVGWTTTIETEVKST